MKLEKPQRVYIIYNPEIKITKVGISNYTEGRKTTLECESGCDLEIKWTSEFITNAITYERRIHEALAQHRRKGEWFNVSPEEAIDTAIKIIAEAEPSPIVTRYNYGVTITQLALDNGVSRQAIIQKLRSLGVYREDEAPHKEEKQLYHQDNYPNAPIDIIDDIQPTKVPPGLKRIEPNISSNGEWHQVSIFKNGSFFHTYTRDINKARAYLSQMASINHK